MNVSDKWMAHLCQRVLVGSFLVKGVGRSGSERDHRQWQRWKPRACTHTLPSSQSDRECCRLLGCQQPAAKEKKNKQTKNNRYRSRNINCCSCWSKLIRFLICRARKCVFWLSLCAHARRERAEDVGAPSRLLRRSGRKRENHHVMEKQMAEC